VKKSINDKLW